jgi:hypothetical protein
MRALSLFSYDRHLIVDPSTQVLWLLTRRHWIRSTFDVVPFRKVIHVIYKFARLPTWIGIVPRAEFTDSVNWFEVSLSVDGRADPLKLFRFAGEGSETTGLLGAILGDTLVDMEGDQEVASRDFVGKLTKIIGVPLRSELEQVVTEALASHAVTCRSCGRRISPSATRCIYCAKTVKSSVPGDA